MLTGHFATALVPYARDRRLPLFTLLLVSQAQDLLIPLDVLRTGQRDLNVLEMTLSHDLLPAFLLALVVAAGLYAWRRERHVALVGAALVVVHEAFDLLSGFSHRVAGAGTPTLGLDLYRSAPATAFAIEGVLGAGCLAYFLWQRWRQGDAVSAPRTAVLVAAILLVPTLMFVRAQSGRPVF